MVADVLFCPVSGPEKAVEEMAARRRQPDEGLHAVHLPHNLKDHLLMRACLGRTAASISHAWKAPASERSLSPAMRCMER